MFRTLIYPSSAALQAEASACKTSPTQNQPHQISNTQRTENKTTNVVIHQHSRRLLKMDMLMSETCWAHNKLNKIACNIKLVFHSSTNYFFWQRKREESVPGYLNDCEGLWPHSDRYWDRHTAAEFILVCSKHHLSGVLSHQQHLL